ncbi:MAG: YhgE/Pip domain-containing protein [Arcanobacterium sp.]|nr:YhgE/Pip domain-containing protein [Arcanobacterium sp.]
MFQSWKIFTRDSKRLFRTKKTWIVLVGVLIIPALYSWVNVRAFWDPYGATAHINVAVVNEDQGASSDVVGSINVGQQVVSELQRNELLGWQFLDADAAEEALKRGDVYASITIPQSFSSDLLHLIDGSYSRPTLHYRANEKSNSVASVITDTAASELDRQITSAVKQQVAQAATTALKSQGADVEEGLTEAHDHAEEAFAHVSQALVDSRSRITTVQKDLTDVQETLSSTKASIAQVETAIARVQTSLNGVQTQADRALSSLSDYADAATSALVEGTAAVADATGTARSVAAEVAAELNGAGNRFDADAARVTDIIERTDGVISTLKQLLDSPDLPPEMAESLKAELDRLTQHNAANRDLLDKLQTLRTDAKANVDSVNGLAQAADQAAQSTRKTAAAARSALTYTLPQIRRAMDTVSSNMSALSANLDAYKQTLSEASALVDGMTRQLAATQGVLSSFDSDFASIQKDVAGVRADVQTLELAAHSDALIVVTGLDASRIGEFFAHPVTVTNTPVFPINSYGSAMAALFTNLSLWIGAFALMVIFRVEVDTEGFEQITVGQAYLGRFLLLALVALGQAGVVTSGDLILGVQSVNPGAFILTGMLIGLAYVSIVYALTSAFGHVGRGLAVVLAILQIPGASGLYPIELMPNFFRLLYPILPLTYGINAMREVIGGFYGHHYAMYMAVLVVMCVLSFGLGLLARKGLAHFHLLFNRELARTHLVRFEKVQVVGRGYRIADIIRAMQGKERFSAELARRTHNHLTWIRIISGIGVAGMIALGVAVWTLPQQKTLLLALFTLWFLVIMGTVVTLEYLRQSLRQSTALSELSDDELRAAIAARGSGIHTDSDDISLFPAVHLSVPKRGGTQSDEEDAAHNEEEERSHARVVPAVGVGHGGVTQSEVDRGAAAIRDDAARQEELDDLKRGDAYQDATARGDAKPCEIMLPGVDSREVGRQGMRRGVAEQPDVDACDPVVRVVNAEASLGGLTYRKRTVSEEAAGENVTGEEGSGVAGSVSRRGKIDATARAAAGSDTSDSAQDNEAGNAVDGSAQVGCTTTGNMLANQAGDAAGNITAGNTAGSAPASDEVGSASAGDAREEGKQ